MKYYYNKNSVSLQIYSFKFNFTMKILFYFLLSGCILVIAACQKEPPKGNYTGRFEGSYTTENQIVYYKTDYLFEIKKVTKNEIHLQEKASLMTSILQKKANDSIVGRIGFGNIYNPSQDSSPPINTIQISGKYYKENAKSQISGSFSTTISFDGKQYPSTGTFVLHSY